MVWAGIPAEKILLLTFTNVAADNMKIRAGKLSDGRCAFAKSCTFHSFCASILRTYWREAGLKPDFTIITGKDVTTVINLVKRQLGYTKLKDFPASDALFKAYSFAKNTDTDWNEMVSNMTVQSIDDSYIPGEEELVYRNEAEVNIRKAILEVMNGYEEYKTDNGYLDYDDLLFIADKLLDNEKVRDDLEEMYPYVMVDEYQDTNHVQERIVFKLTKKHKNLCVVGDDYQSIYAFRGADVNNILTFPQKVPGCKVTKVLTNYRSTSQILEIPNKMMDRYADFGFKKNMVSGVGDGKFPSLYYSENEDIEAQEIVTHIKKWLKSGVAPSKIAVLSRTGLGSARVEALLQKSKIPFIKRGGVKFFELQAIVDMLSLLRVISNQSDELAWFSTLDILPGIGDAYASKLTNELKATGYIDAENYKTCSFYEDLKELLGVISGAKHSAKCLPLPRIFELVKKYYIRTRLKKIELSRVQDEGARSLMKYALKSDVESIKVLGDIASSYETIPAFLSGCVLDECSPKDLADRIVISTIHSAKGMEWDYVWVMGLAEGCIPRKDASKADLRESLRGLYVALTRPKKELYMSCPQEINGKNACLTRFLGIVDEDNTCIYISKPEVERIDLDVPYERKETAKAFGAKWDKERRCWYAPVSLSDECRNALIERFGIIE